MYWLSNRISRDKYEKTSLLFFTKPKKWKWKKKQRRLSQTEKKKVQSIYLSIIEKQGK